jgi:guanyl-specific ribonuclease Sa
MDKHSRLNRIYKKMIDRCYNPKNDNYKYYGGRGITVCEEWLNRKKDLPTHTSDGTPITYRAHDVNDKIQGYTRDAERFVTGSDGSTYYTNDHYYTFTKLK